MSDVRSQVDRATRTVYSTDNSIYQVEPAAVAIPASADDVSALVRNARNAETRSTAVVARGGGTGTNGQSLTDGISIDLKRGLHEILSVDVRQRTAVVQPGVVAGELNAALRDHGLHWAPHTSTLNRATVGGMISTDAAGKGSLVHGRAHRHVVSLTMVLDDGSLFEAAPVPVDEAVRRGEAQDRSGQIWRDLVALKLPVPAELALPQLARGFSGYGLDRLKRDGLIDPVALICGAEGTLGIIVEATVRLTPLHQRTRLVVAEYPSFNAALGDAVDLRNTGPVAIECFDEATLDAGRASPAWPALGAVLGDSGGAVLLLEYADDAADDLSGILETIDATGRSRSVACIDDPIDQASVWKVRADAVGLLGKVVIVDGELAARPTAFVEDCAVPVQAMASFIDGFREILDNAGLSYGMFGHADVGCVHVRPALDLRSATQRQLVTEVTEAVSALLTSHGGILWGEHGRGFRGSTAEDFLTAPTIDLMRQVKTIFDPTDLFNPGKLYRPLDVSEALLAVGDVAMRGESDAEVPAQIRTSFDSAFACNGNGLCHHHGVDEVMCPSYKATRDPALSPKGRADLLRAWSGDRNGNADRDGDDADFEHAIAENLDACLSCSACTGRCPVEVDIPELKSRFFASYYQRHRRPVQHHLLSRFEQLAALGARLPAVSALGLRPAQRLLGLVDLPTPKRTTGSFAEFTPAGSVDIVVLPDVFTSLLEPQTLTAAMSALADAGYSVAVADFVPSGKFDHVKGNRRRFEMVAKRQAQLVNEILDAGARPVVVEPAIALLHDHEYPAINPAHPTGVVRSLAEVLLERRDALTAVSTPSRIAVLGHCTERATSPATASMWTQLLSSVGHEVATPEIGCCGMAGIFGHERANQALSRKVWDLSWGPALQRCASDQQTVVVPGYSCRSQARRFAGTELVHPVHLLRN